MGVRRCLQPRRLRGGAVPVLRTLDPPHYRAFSRGPRLSTSVAVAPVNCPCGRRGAPVPAAVSVAGPGGRLRLAGPRDDRRCKGLCFFGGDGQTTVKPTLEPARRKPSSLIRRGTQSKKRGAGSRGMAP